MKNGNFIALKSFIEHIELSFGLRIHVQKYKNTSFFDSELENVLSQYMIHDCDYCMYIKSNKLLWNKCIQMKNAVIRKCTIERTSFVGTCHAGVTEYIAPIYYNNSVVGYISVGGFKCDDSKKHFVFEKLSEKYGLKKPVLDDKYSSLQNKFLCDFKTLIISLDLVAEYISNIYQMLITTYSIAKEQSPISSKENEVMYNVIEYISKNITNDISVQKISLYCNCSKSFIHHLFKKKMNISIRNYINTLRVEKTKYYLARTDLLIKEIAFKVGFNDSNYFSKVFLDFCGISPTDYRNSFKCSK